MEEANLLDLLEHWTLREYAELICLRAARKSSRRHSLQAALLWMEGRESTEAFDFAFGPMKEYLDDLRTLTLKSKPFGVFSFRQWKSQLRLIEGCYSGQTGVVLELLMVGAPDEISPLFTFETVGIPHHPHVSSWPLLGLCALYTGGSCFRGGCGPADGWYLGLSEIAQRVGMSLTDKNHMPPVHVPMLSDPEGLDRVLDPEGVER